MKVHDLLLGAMLANASAGTVTPAQSTTVEQEMTRSTIQMPIEGDIPSLGGAREWLNSPPLTPAGLRGKVVLIDFWTYTCINWRRTLPYVRAWAEKYKDHGLVVIGVHTPEFGFEKDLGNVRRATTGLEIRYPVAVDSDYVIWRAFRNQYWPALYIADARGRIRHHQFGEGGYEQTERIIQQLLTEAGTAALPPKRRPPHSKAQAGESCTAFTVAISADPLHAPASCERSLSIAVSGSLGHFWDTSVVTLRDIK